MSLLSEALQQVIRRHPVLLSVYRQDEDNEVHQLVGDNEIVIQSQSCQSEDDLYPCVHEHIHLPFDLATEPAMRIYHYQVKSGTDTGEYLLLLWHHIVMDGWSLDVFINELGEAYSALKTGRAAELPSLSITYGDYALWQRAYLAGEAGKTQLDYWQHQLSGYETLTLPTDFERPARVDYRGGEYAFALNEDLSAQLRALAKDKGTTLYTVGLAALYVMLGKFSGQKDIVVGTPSDNRHHAQTQSPVSYTHLRAHETV